jgi:predicted dehydrogenase
VQIHQLVTSGAIGDVRLLSADFGFKGDPSSELLLFDRACGGGSLLDVGIYPLSFAHQVMSCRNTARHRIAYQSNNTSSLDFCIHTT